MKKCIKFMTLFLSILFFTGFCKGDYLMGQSAHLDERQEIFIPIEKEDAEEILQDDTDIEEDFLGIELTVIEETPLGIKLLCHQFGGQATGELFTGSKYWLEKKVEDQWILVETVQENIGWHDDAWKINKNGNAQWSVEWEWLYGTLPPGMYRIGKEILDFRKAGDYDTYFYYAEFELKDELL